MIEIIKSASFFSLVRGAKHQLSQYGVPKGGPMDAIAAHKANALVFNFKNTPILECVYHGPVVHILSPNQFAIAGAEVQPLINNTPTDEKVFQLNEGDQLSFKDQSIGFRFYLAVRGGFKVDPNRINNTTTLSYGHLPKCTQESMASNSLTLKQSEIIEVYPGPEFDQLSSIIKWSLLNQKLTIHPSSSRMAILFNERLSIGGNANMLTSGVCPGMIQWMPDGQLNILMQDAQTTGGYPRIFIVSHESLNLLAQKRPGQKIQLSLKND